MNGQLLKEVYMQLIRNGAVINQKDFAEKIGRSEEMISRAFKNNKKLAESTIYAVNNAFPNVFNLDWLLTGEGDMLQAPQMAQDGFLQVMANDTKPYTQESRDGQISRLLDMIDERDAKIEALLKENAGLRAELASAGIYGKKHG